MDGATAAQFLKKSQLRETTLHKVCASMCVVKSLMCAICSSTHYTVWLAKAICSVACSMVALSSLNCT